MDLDRLGKFIAVAEAGTIGGAANVLHISQPALSRQMRLLEEEVGLTLFERLPRGIRLTAGGQEFLTGARRLLKESAQIVANAVQASQGELGCLAVGASECYTFHPDVLSSIRNYVSQYPGIRFRLVSLLSGEIMRLVDSGELDGGFILSPRLLTSTLDSQSVLKATMSLAVSSMSPLGRQNHCDLSAIDGTDLVLVSREQSPWFYDFQIRLLSDRGVAPRVAMEASSHSAVMAYVAAGVGCALVPSTAHFSVPADVTLLEIDDFNMEFNVDFIWRSRENSLPLSQYISLLQKSGY
ncbi:LysR family transcriptional regulator [Cupriavidus necator]|uniref:LysR family transcriptional regulator n=1 Tax=Cupriavidus necator TaxID=106590 RepID=UPI00339D6B19